MKRFTPEIFSDLSGKASGTLPGPLTGDLALVFVGVFDVFGVSGFGVFPLSCS